ncbi:MAG: trans-sulfuration enzyme family protein [Bacillota bacterium]
MRKEETTKFATALIHGGEPESKPQNALSNPIFMTSTFTFDSLADAEAAFTFASDDYVYTRGNNPTLKVLEEKMACLEGGAEAVAFASGMGAISATLLSLLKPGQEIIAHNVLYGSSYKLITSWLKAYDIEHRLLNLKNTTNLQEQINENTSVIYLETPANPTLEVLDISAIAEIAQENDCKLVVDNTFATPYLQQPLKLGADIVLHSATKYLGGHGDLLGGIVVANSSEYCQNLKFNYLTELGSVLSPFNAWLILRGLKTLKVRVEEAQRNAQEVANFLVGWPSVKAVYYPALAKDKQKEIIAGQMSGPGSMISFELAGEVDQIREFVDSLNYFHLAVSLGDTESLIEYPFFMTHRDYDKKVLAELGINSYLLRLSIGLEDPADLISDLEKALTTHGF